MRTRFSIVITGAQTVARLGEDVQKNNILLREAMDRGLQTLAQYLKWCQEFEVQEIFAAGTSALREAKNAEDFLKLVKVTFRRDMNTYRPRINKPDSQNDQIQKASGNYFMFESFVQKEKSQIVPPQKNLDW